MPSRRPNFRSRESRYPIAHLEHRARIFASNATPVRNGQWLPAQTPLNTLRHAEALHEFGEQSGRRPPPATIANLPPLDIPVIHARSSPGGSARLADPPVTRAIENVVDNE